jgi:hypothetical protein
MVRGRRAFKKNGAARPHFFSTSIFFYLEPVDAVALGLVEACFTSVSGAFHTTSLSTA